MKKVHLKMDSFLQPLSPPHPDKDDMAVPYIVYTCFVRYTCALLAYITVPCPGARKWLRASNYCTRGGMVQLVDCVYLGEKYFTDYQT